MMTESECVTVTLSHSDADPSRMIPLRLSQIERLISAPHEEQNASNICNLATKK